MGFLDMAFEMIVYLEQFEETTIRKGIKDDIKRFFERFYPGELEERRKNMKKTPKVSKVLDLHVGLETLVN